MDGIKLSLDGSCPIPRDSTGTFGNLQAYLQAAPNNVPNVYFFENCTECPECAIEQLGAQLATFLNSLAAPQVDVVAHSMGGLIVRSYLAGKSVTPGVFNPPPTQKIRKAVFLATPHFGSPLADELTTDRKSTRLNSSHLGISYAVFCLKKNKIRSRPAGHPDRSGGRGGLHSLRLRS